MYSSAAIEMSRSGKRFIDLVSSESEVENSHVTPNRKPRVTGRGSSKNSLLKSQSKLRSSSSSSVIDRPAMEHPSITDLFSDADDENDEEISSKGSPSGCRERGPRAKAFGELPLSDPESSIWKGRENANLTIVVQTQKRKLIESIEHDMPSRLTEEPRLKVDDDGVMPGRPKDRLWLHRVESRLPFYYDAMKRGVAWLLHSDILGQSSVAGEVS